MANTSGGVRADSGPNPIGGPAPGAGNVISGNGDRGVWLGSGADHVVQGNLIGTNSLGETPVPNATSGITIDGATTGSHTLSANVVSGNLGAGVEIVNGAHDITLAGNKIGTNLAGTAALGSGFQGVVLAAGAHDNTIGLPGQGNLISGNAGVGVGLFAGANSNLVEGNLVGTTTDGMSALGNAGGVWIEEPQQPDQRRHRSRQRRVRKQGRRCDARRLDDRWLRHRMSHRREQDRHERPGCGGLRRLQPRQRSDAQGAFDERQ
jgi:hypothetical protein